MSEAERQNIPAKRWTCKHWHSGQHANASEPCGYCALEAEVEALRKALQDIASGELGVNLCIKVAQAALAARPGGAA